MYSETYKTPFSIGDNVIYSKKGEITDIKVSNDADIYYVVKFGDRHSIITTSNNLRMNNESSDLDNLTNQFKNMNMHQDMLYNTYFGNKKYLSTMGGKRRSKRNKSKKSRKSRKQGLH
jgi:negative regulator of genetic competence, sporulation and motility